MTILYGAVIGGKLYRIDTATGSETVVGDGVDRSYVGITVDSAGAVYASATDGNIYKFDLLTGTLLRTYATGLGTNMRGICLLPGRIAIAVNVGSAAYLNLVSGAVTSGTDSSFANGRCPRSISALDVLMSNSSHVYRSSSFDTFPSESIVHGLFSGEGCTYSGNLIWVAGSIASFSDPWISCISGGVPTLYHYAIGTSFWGAVAVAGVLYLSATGGRIYSRTAANVADTLTTITSVDRNWQDLCIATDPSNPFQILTPCTLQMLCDSKVANSSSGRRRTVSRDSSFVFSATLNLPSECEQFEAVPYYDFPVIGDCEIRQLDLVKYTFRDTEKTSSVKCVIVPNIMQKRTGDFRISCEPNISMDEAMLVATGSSSLEVLSSSRALSLKCVWTVSFLAATQFIEWLRGSVNRIFTTSVGGMKGVACQIGDSVSLEIGSADVKISADLAIVNTKQFPLNVTASRVGNVVTVSTGTAYTGTLVNRSGEIVEVVATATNVLTFTTYPENCYLLIREGGLGGIWNLRAGSNVTEWLEL